MRGIIPVIAITLVATTVAAFQEKGSDAVSFQKDVFPILKKHCLPCHAEDNFNPSELALDSFEKLMEGGKHGAAVKAGNAKESLIVRKSGTAPPFGDRMPLHKKKRGEESAPQWLSDAEMKVIADWIDQGAKNN